MVNDHSGQAAQSIGISVASASSQGSANPLDKLSSADIAESIAAAANLPETTAVRNQAETVQAELAVPPAEDVVAAKPQVIATNLKDREDIQLYIVKSGDTLASLASKFDVTSSSLSWSNNLDGNALTPGTKLYIPPINGIVYKVKSGDTPQSLAQTYSSSTQQIIQFNDAEIGGLTPGELIVIPNGQIQPAETSYSYSSSSFSAYGFSPAYGDNGYDYGFCTWYVASQISVPNNWGNASSWAYYAQLSGWQVSSTPTVGAIAQTPYAAGGEGHVAIVTAVKGNMIEYKDMNGLAGWGRVGYSSWVSASSFPNYISK